MMTDAVLERVTRVFRDVLGNDALALAPESSPGDVAGWDSFANATLVVALETEFGIRFRAAELRTMTTVGKVAEAVRAKVSH